MIAPPHDARRGGGPVGGPWKPRQLVFTARASRDPRKLPADAAARVLAMLTRYAETGQGDVVQLTDVRPPVRRLRAGDYRAFVAEPPADAPDTLPVRAVRNRREAY